jgi:hypothetical protein
MWPYSDKCLGMKPDRFEWLHQEKSRVAREGTGRQFVQYQIRQHYLRSIGIFGVMLPVILIMTKLPTQTEGPLKPLPLLFVGLGTVTIGAVGLLTGARRCLVGWWAVSTAISFGVLLAVGSALV